MGTQLSRLCRLLGLLLLVYLSAIPLSAQRGSDFMKEFRLGISKSDMQLQDKTMKKHEFQAVLAIIETCQEIADGSSAVLEKEIKALMGSWKRVYKTKFAEQQYRYFSRMKPAIREARSRLRTRYGKLYKEFQAAREGKNGRGFAGFGAEFKAMSAEFEKMGDLYMASDCAWYFAHCYDENLNGDKANLQKACEGYGLVVKHRKRIELDDKIYTQAKVAFDELEYRGFGSADKGPEARKRAKAEADPSYKAAPLELTFEVAPKFSALPRPNYDADSIYPIWQSVNLKRVGSVAKIDALGDDSPSILRQAVAKVSMDSDGDGKGDTPIAVNGNLNVIRCSLGEGDSKREWAFRAITGSSRDTLQGITPFNLAADELNMAIYIAPAASMVGMIAETRIQIIDDNMDGLYGSTSQEWGFMGLRKGDNQVLVDSIVIGKSKRAQPWSETVKIGEDWYSLYSKDNGAGISFSRVDVETGIVKLDLKGLKASYVLIQGTGNNKKLYYDVAGSKKGVEVPAGTYSLLSGMVSKGKRDSKLKALIVGTSEMDLIRVAAGETVTLALGAPFKFDFDFSQNAEEVTVIGSQIVVTGRGGESYQRLYNCRPQPEVSLRKAGGRKGSKGEKMKLATNQNDITDDGFARVWAPYDKVVEKSSEKKMEVRLFEKKNKLFGKITSDWKKE